MNTQPIFFLICERWWQVERRDSRAFWQALASSNWTIPREFRQKLMLYSNGVGTDLQLMHSTLNPSTVMEVLEHLCREQRLSRERTSRVQRAILVHVGAEGRWL